MPGRCNVRLIKIKNDSVSLCRFVTVYLTEKGEEEWFAMNVWFTSLILLAIIGTSLQ